MSIATAHIKTEKQFVPALRFKEFDGDYEEYKLSELMNRYSEINKDEEFGLDDILSLSSHHGIVNRKELLEDIYSKVNPLNYIKTRLNDFVYGKSITASYPYGLFKVNNCKDGLLSTLYFTFKVRENISPMYLDCYFSYHNRANNFLKKYVLVGDRYITADANYILSGQIFIPLKQEQKKIVSFLSAVDEKIQQITRKKELLEQYKKGVMQQLFSGKLRFKDENGKAFAKWVEKRLGDVAERVVRKNKENNLNVLTISAQQGLISQLEYFNKSVSAKDVSNYYLLHKDEFAYNKSYSTGFPMGAIKRLIKYNKGVVSTLYICFRFNKNVSLSFMEQYFENGYQNTEIEKVAQEGARNHGLLNIGLNDFFNISLTLPSKQEQEKISNYLSNIDNKIEIVNKQITQTQTFKKGLLQQMFI